MGFWINFSYLLIVTDHTHLKSQLRNLVPIYITFDLSQISQYLLDQSQPQLEHTIGKILERVHS